MIRETQPTPPAPASACRGPRLGTLTLCRDGKRGEEFEWENQGCRIQKGSEGGTCRPRTGGETSPLWGESALGAAFPPKALVFFFEAYLPFLKNQVLLSEASTQSSPEEMLPPPGPSQNQCPGPPFCLVCLTVPQKARGLDSLCAFWLQPLLVMGSRQQD